MYTFIDFKGDRYYFQTDFEFKRLQKIIEEFKGQKPEDKIQWWKRPSELGEFILRELSIGKYPHGKFREKNLSQKEWYTFIPILQKYFITLKEEMKIRSNLLFLVGANIIPRADYYFMKYTMLKEFSGEFDLNLLPYKEAIILCRYLIGQIQIRNRTINNIQNDLINEADNESKKQEGMLV